VSNITVAFPLYAGNMVSSLFPLIVRSASFSALFRLCAGLEAFFIILTVSCLASSACSTGRFRMAFSIPANVSSIGLVLGVMA
jgi:hypothetical protein